MVDFKGLGCLLAKQRRESGLTQDAVAEIVGVTDKTIRNIEYGCTAADFETIMKLWDLYNLPCDVLFVFYTRSYEMQNAIDFFMKTFKKTKLRI